MRSSEDYVRPPLVASEAPSAAAARWRYRVTALVLAVLAVVLLVSLFLKFSDVTGGEDPGLIGAPSPLPAAAPAR